MSGPNTFAGGTLDRAGERRRDDAWLAERLRDPASRAVLVAPAGVAVTGGADPRAALVGLDAVASTSAEPPLLLGVDAAGAALFAVEIDASAPSGPELAGLRDVAARLPAADAALLAYATALVAGRRRTRFCGACGTANEAREAGHVRVCPRCGAHVHPRTDPVVIVVVTDSDRALLGRQPSWPAGRYSALAGFVEPGESLEEAVRREVGEEAGVTVADTRGSRAGERTGPAVFRRYAASRSGTTSGSAASASSAAFSSWSTRVRLSPSRAATPAELVGSPPASP